MSERLAIDFVVKNKEGKVTVLCRAYEDWSGYTENAADLLLQLCRKIREGYENKEMTNTGVFSFLFDDLLLKTFGKENVVAKDTADEYGDDYQWYSMVEVFDPAHPRVYFDAFVKCTLSEELLNCDVQDRSELLEDHGFIEIGDDPIDVGVFVAVRDGYPLTEGGLLHFREMLSRLPSGGGGGFIAHGCSPLDSVIETH